MNFLYDHLGYILTLTIGLVGIAIMIAVAVKGIRAIMNNDKREDK